MRVKNTGNIPVAMVYFKFNESCVPYDYFPRSKYHDLDHGCINLYCNLGAHEYLDLDPVIVHGLTSNTSVKNPKISQMITFVVIVKIGNGVKILTILYEYMTALHREYLDLDPGVVNGLTSNTKRVKTSKILSCKYLPSKSFTDYTTALHRVVSYPKLIKLGSTGSSTKRCGAVKKFNYTKKSKFTKKFSKNKKFQKN
jgi:hypothetical protein